MAEAASFDRSEIKILTFDLYGTIVDMQSGLVEFGESPHEPGLVVGDFTQLAAELVG